MKSDLVILMVGAFAFCGCSETRSGNGIGLESVADQQFSYAYVKERVGELEPGMTEQQVLFILGTPAGKQGNVWKYMNIRPGLIIPSEKLNVEFMDRRYLRYWFRR